MEVILAISPILIVLLMLFVLKQSVVRAGIVGCVASIIIAFILPEFELLLIDIPYPVIKGLLTTSIVAYVLLFGILLFNLMNEEGVIRSFAALVAKSTEDPVRQVLILAVALSPLIESSSGFGLAAIVIAPILIALGFKPYKAVLISLVSLSAVPWGSLATGTVIGANLAGLSAQELGAGTALLSIPTFIYFSYIIAFIADGWVGIKRRFFEILFIALTLGGSVWAFSHFISVELAGVFGSMVALGVELVLIQLFQKKPLSVSQVAVTRDGATHHPFKALSPYLFLVVLLLSSRIIPWYKNFSTNNLVIALPEYQHTLPIIFNPGFFLFLACIFTIVIFNIEGNHIKISLHKTFRQWTPVIISTLFFVIMAEVMSVSGMIHILSVNAALLFGGMFFYISPLIGGLGGFLAGSNTGSNSMFINLQVQTANQLGLSPNWVAFAQNTSSSHLIMANPSRILLTASIGEIPEKQNELLNKIGWIGLGTVLIICIEMIVANLML
ncbi:L-lactate permease [Hazenella sp. IB182353]|uniref:L-lactate permease n=1 Tax=Polycladospora coralii TaxID=2771432 RepID=UPI0017477BE1|nr:L-lactate permease [Polycladospora coralii]MBS7529017.1 L-lactate permease [Polycladospora coralii]